MKKILGILMVAVICILGLCSCASPETRAKNRDLAEKIGDRLNEGQVVFEVSEENKKIVRITKGGSTNDNYNWYYVTKLTQYNKYFVLNICGDYASSRHLTKTYSNNYYWEFEN